jgi:hypothetical protein
MREEAVWRETVVQHLLTSIKKKEHKPEVFELVEGKTFHP